MLLIESPLRELEDSLVPDFAYACADEDIEDRVVMMFYREAA